MTRRSLSLKNEGSFEGYVGNIPKPVENTRGVPQCYLHVGHTPCWSIDGKKQRGKTVWCHFACFERVAVHVLENIKRGDKVMVDYDLTMQPDPRYGQKTSFRTVRVRLIANPFAPRGEADTDGDELWRPPKPKEGNKWDEVHA